MFHLFLSSQVDSCFRQHLGSRLVSACAGWPEWASADSQLAGEGGREEGIILRIRDDNVGRLLICCVADKVMMMTRLASSSHQSTEAGWAERMRLCWRTLCPLLATGGRGLRLCGLGSPSGGWWEEDATNTDLLPPPQLAWWHTARYTQISATLGQISQNVLMQRRDDLKTYNSFR